MGGDWEQVGALGAGTGHGRGMCLQLGGTGRAVGGEGGAVQLQDPSSCLQAGAAAGCWGFKGQRRDQQGSFLGAEHDRCGAFGAVLLSSLGFSVTCSFGRCEMNLG